MHKLALPEILRFALNDILLDDSLLNVILNAVKDLWAST